ncbi:MAG: hypothetical protein R6X25_09810 [Candidatus Krumholzibacteriia bacterium]
MWSHRNALTTLFLFAIALTGLFGCRAFEPEAVIVNKPPETYIVGAPAETTGGYYHFHVYWYGSDADGFVERYVWALTDTARAGSGWFQDNSTDEDEEDQLFNPAVNISTLDIGQWTTRTDTIFDFRLNDGANLSRNLTLHMVAVDDRGAFDRTPARLHFISNALGNPQITFFRGTIANGETTFAPTVTGRDTLAYGTPMVLRWEGTTPNLMGYSPELLAQRDTVPPRTDGLYGFQWRIPGAFGDVWRPRELNEATGDSFSYFGGTNQLVFENDVRNSSNPFRLRMKDKLRLYVNTIDVAGVQVPAFKQLFELDVNFEPQTEMIVGKDPFYAQSDTNTYPYFVVFHGPNAGLAQPFNRGDRVPDRAYVVFKAAGRDDPRDLRDDPDYGVTFQGAFTARGFYQGSNEYTFSSTFSDTHRTLAWTPNEPDGWATDTIGISVGPFDYTVTLRGVDEHGRRDNTRDSFQFSANFPPCVQCVEILGLGWEGQTEVTYEDPCEIQACFADTTTLLARTPGLGVAGDLVQAGPAPIWVNPTSDEVTFEQPPGIDWFQVSAWRFTYRIALHGRSTEAENEYPPDLRQRVMAWTYQVDYERDLINQIRDGEQGAFDTPDEPTGIDNFGIGSWTNEFGTLPNNRIYIDSTGIWYITVDVYVPQTLLYQGPETWWIELLGNQSLDHETRVKIWNLATLQLGEAKVRALATDQGNCQQRNTAGKYYYYQGTRIPERYNPGRNCNPGEAAPFVLGELLLEDFRANSEGVAKHFRIGVKWHPDEPAFFGGPPPGSAVGRFE